MSRGELLQALKALLGDAAEEGPSDRTSQSEDKRGK